MNRLLIAVAASSLLASSSVATAQEQPTRQYLPEEGDFAIGIDVMPLLKTIGNAFSKDESVPVGGSPFVYGENNLMYLKPNVSIAAKYMLSDSWGLKLNLGLAVRDNQNRYYITDDLANYLDPNSGAKVTDTEKIIRSGGSLMFGAEYRVGRQRVQGVFGAGVLLGFSTSTTKYSYGNEITEFNRTPSGSFSNNTGVNLPDGYRITEAKTQDPNFTGGIYGSAGVEWFVAPKIALGAEVDLTLYGTVGSKGFVKSEGYNEAYRQVEERTDLVTPGNRSLSFGTENLGGSLYMIFYF